MTKPQKQDYGWNEDTGWTQGDKARFEYDLAIWKVLVLSPGRQRTRPIHPSWESVLKHFDSTNPQRSQGAFCRWGNLNRGTFSAMQCKAIPMHIAELVGAWNAQGKEVENG